jgi:hypothetical protein
MNNSIFKKSVSFVFVCSLLICLKSYGQYLPLSGGGTVTGPVIATNLMQAGGTIDLAPSSVMTISSGSTNYNGGANSRNYLANTRLPVSGYLTIDLGIALPISYIIFGTYYSIDTNYPPAGFNIDYSNDNVTFTNYKTVTGNTSLNQSYAPNITARYWKLTVTAVQSGQTLAHISGFQLITQYGGAIGNNLWATPYYSGNIFTNSPVSVGTSVMPPGYLLAVNGSAIATSMTVQLNANWPDYVFKKEYPLLPLDKVKAYIDQNQRLPEIPSEQQIAKDGLNLGDMNKVLVKKVEELTLYLIDLQKQVKAQQMEIDELKKK